MWGQEFLPLTGFFADCLETVSRKWPRLGTPVLQPLSLLAPYPHRPPPPPWERKPVRGVGEAFFTPHKQLIAALRCLGPRMIGVIKSQPAFQTFTKQRPASSFRHPPPEGSTVHLGESHGKKWEQTVERGKPIITRLRQNTPNLSPKSSSTRRDIIREHSPLGITAWRGLEDGVKTIITRPLFLPLPGAGGIRPRALVDFSPHPPRPKSALFMEKLNRLSKVTNHVRVSIRDPVCVGRQAILLCLSFHHRRFRDPPSPQMCQFIQFLLANYIRFMCFLHVSTRLLVN